MCIIKSQKALLLLPFDNDNSSDTVMARKLNNKYIQFLTYHVASSNRFFAL